MLTTLTTIGFFGAFAAVFQSYLNRLIETDRANFHLRSANPDHASISGDDYDLARSSFH